MKQGFFTPDEEISALVSRLCDLCEVAARGEMAATPYLTPREAKYARAYLASRVSVGTAVAWGGYREAERVRMILLPDYLEGMVDPTTLAADPVSALRDTGIDDTAKELSDLTVPLRVQGSGFRVLTHRDYLGSILALGLDRDAVGDVSVTDDRTAIIVCGAPIAEFLMTHLERVATDAVRVSRLPEGETIPLTHRFAPVSDTVASERLDCVVAALCNLSRDKAQTAVRSGLVEVDYETVEDCSATVDAPAVISVRGYGKFAVHSFDGTTRKGRIRLVAGKYI